MQSSQHRNPERRDARQTHRQELRLKVLVASALVVASVLVVLDTAMWFRLERVMDRRLDAFARQARAEGWHFTAQAGDRGGWPLAATLTLRHPSLRFPGKIVTPPVVGNPSGAIVDNTASPTGTRAGPDVVAGTVAPAGPAANPGAAGVPGPGAPATTGAPPALPGASGQKMVVPLAPATSLQAPPGGGIPKPSPEPAYGIAWSGDAVTMSVSPWRPWVTTLLAVGTQNLSVSPAAGFPMPLRFWGAQIALSLPAKETGSEDRPVVLDADALHVALPGAGPDDVVRVAAMAGRLHWNGKAASLRLVLRDIALPIMPGRPDDRIVQHASFEIGLQRTDAGTVGDQPAGPEWLRPGTAVRLNAADIDWDGLGASLTGDARLQPDGDLAGRFAMTVDDSDQMLAKMRDAGLIAPGTAVSARAVAGLIAKAATGPQMRVSLGLEHGVVSLGTIPILRFPASIAH